MQNAKCKMQNDRKRCRGRVSLPENLRLLSFQFLSYICVGRGHDHADRVTIFCPAESETPGRLLHHFKLYGDGGASAWS